MIDFLNFILASDLRALSLSDVRKSLFKCHYVMHILVGFLVCVAFGKVRYVPMFFCSVVKSATADLAGAKVSLSLVDQSHVVFG